MQGRNRWQAQGLLLWQPQTLGQMRLLWQKLTLHLQQNPPLQQKLTLQQNLPLQQNPPLPQNLPLPPRFPCRLSPKKSNRFRDHGRRSELAHQAPSFCRRRRRPGQRIMRRMRCLWILSFVYLGCAGPNPRNVDVSVNTRVDVTIDPTPSKLPFDPRGARLVSAFRQLREIAGHPIALELDAAVSPESRASFEEALINAIAAIARDLDAMRRRDELLFRFAVAHLNRVQIRYDAAQSRDDVHLDEPSRSVIIRGPAVRSSLVGEGTVSHVLSKAYDDQLESQFAQQDPSSVAPTERRAYSHWLENSDRRSVDESTIERLAESPRAALTLRALRLLALDAGRDPVLAKELQGWLLSRASYFEQTYVNHGSLVMALPPNSNFDKAARAWTKWALGVFRQLEADEQLRLTEALFVRSFQQDRAVTHRSYPPFAWPGADLFEFGLLQVDAWRTAGHPNQRSKPPSSQMMEFIVCTRPAEPDGSHSLVPHCDEDWYRFALESETGRQRLAQAIMARADPLFTETVFRNVTAASSQGLPMMLVLLRAIENDAADWKAGWRVLSEYIDGSFDSNTLDETRRLWVTRPDRRATLLSGLAHMDRYNNGNVDWQGFRSAFGAPISASEFGDYVATDPLAISYAPIIWPALGHGWSRAALIVPKLDTWLVDPRVSANNFQDPYQALLHIISELCGEKNVQDLEWIRTYVVARTQAHPGEPYASLVEDTRAKACEPPPPPPPARNEVKLSPLKRGLPPLRVIQPGAE